MNKVVLAVLAHPDDAEFLCAGVLVRLRREHGWAAHVATMTPGDCGSTEYPPDEIARIRRGEGDAAAKSIGATYHCLEERDLRVVYGEAVLEKVVRLINKVGASVVLTHSPDVVPELPRAFALVLAGHTHCGQVSLPLLGPPMTSSDYGQRYACGVIRENGRTILVSAGLGVSLLPIRFGKKPDWWMVTIGR